MSKFRKLYERNKDYLRIDLIMYLVMIIIIALGLWIIA